MVPKNETTFSIRCIKITSCGKQELNGRSRQLRPIALPPKSQRCNRLPVPFNRFRKKGVFGVGEKSLERFVRERALRRLGEEQVFLGIELSAPGVIPGDQLLANLVAIAGLA